LDKKDFKMKLKLFFVPMAIFFVVMSNSLLAANLNFDATVATSCTLNVGTTGVMTVDNSIPSLMSTGNAGGNSGSLAVSFTGTPTLTVTMPTAFSTSPTIGFSPIFMGTVNSSSFGSMIITQDVATDTYTSGNGDAISVGLSVSTGGSTAFPLGSYQAVVTATCS
jgi:hypothetical protein